MTQVEFQGYLSKILTARYGEEVRGSIHDALKGMNEIVQGNVLDVTTAKNTIDTAANNANKAAADANAATNRANDAAAIIETLNLGDINVGEIATKRYVDDKKPGENLFGGSNEEWDNIYIDNWNAPYPDGKYITVGEKGEVSTGESLTISFEIFYDCKVDEGQSNTNCGLIFQLMDENFSSVDDPSNLGAVISRNSGVQKFTKTMNITNNPSVRYIRPLVASTQTDKAFFRIRRVKLERGTVATKWTPCPKDYKIISGKNLIKNSKQTINSSSYFFSSNFHLVTKERPVNGLTYTIQIKGTLGEGRTNFSIYNNNGNGLPLVTLSKADQGSDGIYRRTFKWNDYYEKSGNVGVNNYNTNSILYIYQNPSSISSSSQIEWIKLERGSIATDWTPSDEDDT